MDKKDLPKLIIAAVLIVFAGIATYLVMDKEQNNEKNETKNHENDGKLFGEDYEVEENTPFIILDEEELLDFMENGSGILFLGFPECPFCHAIAPVLNEVLIENHVAQAYYFNPKEIRSLENDTYKKLVEFLGDNLLEDENGEKKVYVPDVYLVKKGEILGHHLDVVEGFDPQINPELTEEQTAELKQIYLDLINLDTEAAGCEVRC